MGHPIKRSARGFASGGNWPAGGGGGQVALVSNMAKDKIKQSTIMIYAKNKLGQES